MHRRVTIRLRCSEVEHGAGVAGRRAEELVPLRRPAASTGASSSWRTTPNGKLRSSSRGRAAAAARPRAPPLLPPGAAASSRCRPGPPRSPPRRQRRRRPRRAPRARRARAPARAVAFPMPSPRLRSLPLRRGVGTLARRHLRRRRHRPAEPAGRHGSRRGSHGGRARPPPTREEGMRAAWPRSRTPVSRPDLTAGTRNSPSRLRFRPLGQLTVRFRVELR
jgi:hypothetical protein